MSEQCKVFLMIFALIVFFLLGVIYFTSKSTLVMLGPADNPHKYYDFIKTRR